MYVCAYVCAIVYVDTRVSLSTIPCFIFFFWDRVSDWTWRFLIGYTGWSSSPRNSLSLPSHWDYNDYRSSEIHIAVEYLVEYVCPLLGIKQKIHTSQCWHGGGRKNIKSLIIPTRWSSWRKYQIILLFQFSIFSWKLVSLGFILYHSSQINCSLKVLIGTSYRLIWNNKIRVRPLPFSLQNGLCSQNQFPQRLNNWRQRRQDIALYYGNTGNLDADCSKPYWR